MRPPMESRRDRRSIPNSRPRTHLAPASRFSRQPLPLQREPHSPRHGSGRCRRGNSAETLPFRCNIGIFRKLRSRVQCQSHAARLKEDNALGACHGPAPSQVLVKLAAALQVRDTQRHDTYTLFHQIAPVSPDGHCSDRASSPDATHNPVFGLCGFLSDTHQLRGRPSARRPRRTNGWDECQVTRRSPRQR